MTLRLSIDRNVRRKLNGLSWVCRYQKKPLTFKRRIWLGLPLQIAEIAQLLYNYRPCQFHWTFTMSRSQRARVHGRTPRDHITIRTLRRRERLLIPSAARLHRLSGRV